MPDNVPVPTRPITIAELKRRIRPGTTFDVTNHCIRRPGRPFYRTTRRVVLGANRVAFTLSTGEGAKSTLACIEWRQVGGAFEDEEGRLLLYGGGRGRSSEAPFLTLVPVPGSGADASSPE